MRVISDLLTRPPFNYDRPRADATSEKLRDWWPSIADGDKEFAYTAEELGDAALAAYVNAFNDSPPVDNDLSIELKS